MKSPRRRRSPAEAEREILEAAEAFLQDQPFRDLTVNAVMARTDLSRPAFYVYFRDRYAVVTRIIERVGAELFAIDQDWLNGPAGNSRGEVGSTLAAAAAFFARRGTLLRAIADAAAGDTEVERLYRFGLVARFAAAVSARIRRGVDDGEMDPGLDPDAVALALVLMTERSLLDTVSRTPTIDPGPIVAALTTIWTKTLYDPD